MSLLTAHGTQAPSPWVRRFTPLIAPGASVLDLACGHGRHMRWLAPQGFRLTGVDRDADAIAALQGVGEALVADSESGSWPLPGRRFGAVIVTNYLWRPLMPQVLDSVAEGGVLIYETFAVGNETVGKPSRPDFLLQPGELLHWCAPPDWRVLAYEDGFLPAPDRFVQRIAAVRPVSAAAQAGAPMRAAERYPLS